MPVTPQVGGYMALLYARLYLSLLEAPVLSTLCENSGSEEAGEGPQETSPPLEELGPHPYVSS
jgi:hypothetical protein